MKTNNETGARLRRIGLAFALATAAFGASAMIPQAAFAQAVGGGGGGGGGGGANDGGGGGFNMPTDPAIPGGHVMPGRHAAATAATNDICRPTGCVPPPKPVRVQISKVREPNDECVSGVATVTYDAGGYVMKTECMRPLRRGR